MDEIEKPNIIIIARYDTNAIGGQAKFATSLGQAISEKFNIYYLSPPSRNNVTVLLRIFYFIKLTIQLLYCITRNKIEIVHIFSACNRTALYEKIIFGLVAKVLFCKVIINFRDAIDINYKIYSTFEWEFIIKLLSKFDIILSQYKKQNLFLGKEGISENKLKYIYNGIFLNEFKEFPSKRSDNDYIDVLFIGEVGLRKGVDTILKAANKLDQFYEGAPPCKISIYGPEFNKGFKLYCNKYIKDNKLNSIISLYPPIIGEDKYKRLSQCDIFILPTHSEGFPNSILEAMLYGKAIITTDVGALDEVIWERINGLKIQPGNATELCNSLLTLIYDDNLRNKLGSQAKLLIKNRFSFKRVSIEFSELYKSLIN